MGTTPINQLPYPEASDDSDITAVSTLADAIDELLIPSLTRSQVASRYPSPEEGALFYDSGNSMVCITRGSEWLTGNYMYAPLRGGAISNYSATDYMYVPGATFNVYSGERYIFDCQLTFYLSNVGNTIEFAWDSPAMTTSSWNLRNTGTSASKRSDAITVAKTGGTSSLVSQILKAQGFLQPSADGVMALKFRKSADVDPSEPAMVSASPNPTLNTGGLTGSSYVRYARIT